MELKTETLANIKSVMTDLATELTDLDPSLSLTGEIFVDFRSNRVWYKVWNEDANTTHYVAQVPERSALGESLVAVDDTTEALMFD
ncbi:hypothetical protein SEA_SAVAGE2526_53 [Arthrobacter phage Savage2526]|uniref:Uncharacterized protein n=12 Tax=Korravirus TaxID=1982076 RepID=A0A3S9U9V0_9CAUD|nr:hypothetical protein KDJ08_gp53 [Arthrobacter phage Wawa]ALY09262.1 hypothetical protein IMMACULATA_52 [Arthrobacter phage Immaculata]ATW58924.1 hypothetical protein PHIRE_FLUKE_53 [Arthrobacter phage Fluke]AZF97429.1 hypothetical protein SEA_CARPAL_52 [Arthrobacter phage Carpal]AZF98516.1 hypothetical protein SEA_BEETHOVEN_52 [Arthrobacter phage Beethoven]AZS07096.1 hypothetical protein SEA_CHOLULA_52 [Arthrobacter phage Cholula]AZS09805.1 hypothetical protein SEA_ROZBY_52 [Arthrobacter p